MKTHFTNSPHFRFTSQLRTLLSETLLRQKRLASLGIGMLALLSSVNPAYAALTIYVSESGSNVVFNWNGTIGDSGAATTVSSTFPTADYIDPKNGNTQYAWSAADRSLTGVDGTGAGNWTAIRTYAGSTTSVYGTGEPTSSGSVSGGGLPFTVGDNATGVGLLYVNTAESLATAVFSGTYTHPGSIAGLGIFDTPATAATEAAPFVLWSSTASGSSGAIQFVVVPEPSTTILGGLFVSLMVCFHRKRRA